MNEKIYKVVAYVWDEKNVTIVERVQGIFRNYNMAHMFKTSYDKEYHTESKIIEM